MLKYLAYRFKTQVLFLNSFLMATISFQIWCVFGINYMERIFLGISSIFFGLGCARLLNNILIIQTYRKHTESPKDTLCPMCTQFLISNGSVCIETLDDHVSCNQPSHRHTLKCGNGNCKLYGKMFWSKEGETYAAEGCDYKEFDELTKLCIDKNNAPFGTFERKHNVEINKDDENYTLFKSDKLRIEVVWWYLSDYGGNILFKKPKLQIWHRSATMRGSGMTLYVPGIKMFLHCVKHFHSSRKWKKDILKEYSIRANWTNAEWWRKWSYKYMCVYDKLFPVKRKKNPVGIDEVTEIIKAAFIKATVVKNKDMPTTDEKADVVMSPESGYKRQYGDVVQKPSVWMRLIRKHTNK